MPTNMESKTMTHGSETFNLQSQKRDAKDFSNYKTTALISHMNKVMLKILQ